MSEIVRVNFIVEGQTEETFVRDLLRDALAHGGIFISVRRVATGRKHGHTHRGGMTTYGKAKRDVQRWLQEDHTAYVTTMFDCHGLPHDFPNYDAAKKRIDPYQKALLLETGIADDIQSRRLIPYIQLHEFEGLLFSDTSAIDAILKIHHANLSQASQLQKIREQFQSPEEINEGEATAPSKRLKALYPGYDKTGFGPRIAKRIGLESLRKQCRHFDEWLKKLEALSIN